MDPSSIVRSGYNAIAGRYLDSRLRGIDQVPLLRDFIGAAPKAATILDATGRHLFVLARKRGA